MGSIRIWYIMITAHEMAWLHNWIIERFSSKIVHSIEIGIRQIYLMLSPHTYGIWRMCFARLRVCSIAMCIILTKISVDFVQISIVGNGIPYSIEKNVNCELKHRPTKHNNSINCSVEYFAYRGMYLCDAGNASGFGSENIGNLRWKPTESI